MQTTADMIRRWAAERPDHPALRWGDGQMTYAEWPDAEPADDPMVPQAADDVAYQLYSSGTTGLPKGVQLTQANFDAGLPLYPAVRELGSDSVSLVAMPLFHIGGGGWLLAGI